MYDYSMIQLWCNCSTIPQLHPAIGSNYGDNYGLDPMVGCSCGMVPQLHHSFAQLSNYGDNCGLDPMVGYKYDMIPQLHHNFAQLFKLAPFPS